jgi:hypothetical protein
MGRCDKVGVPVENRGRWEPFHPHRLGSHVRSDYWNDDGWNFEPDLSRVLRFKVRFAPKEGGEYPVLFKLGGPSLYRTLEVPGTVYVEDAPDGSLGPEDQIGALITEGEQLYRKWEQRPEATLSHVDDAARPGAGDARRPLRRPRRARQGRGLTRRGFLEWLTGSQLQRAVQRRRDGLGSADV